MIYMIAMFQIKGRPGQYHFVLLAGNGEPVPTSETYTSMEGASTASRW
jgi:uncharacterized protein YegP (UPF0339 family)